MPQICSHILDHYDWRESWVRGHWCSGGAELITWLSCLAFFRSWKCKNWYYQWFTPSHLLVRCIYYVSCFPIGSKPVHVSSFQIYWCAHEQCFPQCLVYSSRFASPLTQPKPMWILWNIWHTVGHLWKNFIACFLAFVRALFLCCLQILFKKNYLHSIVELFNLFYYGQHW